MDPIKVSEVFVPGRLPGYTYNPRASVALEGSLDSLIEDGGSVICVSGLTKMGKTVLVERLRPAADHVRVDGSQFSSIEDFWIRVGDRLGIYPNISLTVSGGLSAGGSIGGKVALPGMEVNAAGNLGGNAVTQDTRGAVRPIGSVALEALMNSGKSLIIDDFHFIERSLQRAVIRSLKDPIFRGLTAIVISTSHRTLDVILAEPNMDGRAESLKVTLWSEDELAFIADAGFRVLNLRDPDGAITAKLTSNAFGSPHLMQKFCKNICAINGVRSKQSWPTPLAAPDDWDSFFMEQVEGVAERWFERLLRGPQERGTPRNKWPRREGGQADNYALIMEALAIADGGFEVTKDRIREVIDGITEKGSPSIDKTTRALQRISKIAGRPLEGAPLTEESVDEEPQGDVHFVLEFVEEGPNSKIHITDPFFAYYLRWGARDRIRRHIQEGAEG